MASMFHRHQFTFFAAFFQILFMILFAIFSRYASHALPSGSTSTNFINTNYPLLQDVQVMVLVGMGFTMVFLRRYGLASLSMNLLLTALVMQWALIFRGLLSKEFSVYGYFSISVLELVPADFSVFTVLITMGAVLGKLTPVQYMVMAFIEVPISVATEHFVMRYLMVNDVGRSMVVHAFGAYFGLAVEKAINKKEMVSHQHEGSSYNSDIFAMIGTLFLWAFFPSFNAVLAYPEHARHRAILNTYFALCTSTITTFLISQILDREHKYRFSMAHVANSVLSGAIAIGSVADIIQEPVFALLIGCLGGFVSVLGNHYVKPISARVLGIHDTRGVGGFHGLPGILSGILGFIVNIAYITPSHPLAPRNFTQNPLEPLGKVGPLEQVHEDVLPSYQIGSLAFVLLVSIVGGILTGVILRSKCFNHIHEKEYYSDGEFIEPPEDYDFTTRIISKIDHIELTEHTALTNKEAPSPVVPGTTA